MEDTILALGKQLISIRSTSSNPTGLEEVLELAVSELTGFPLERFERNGVKSILAYNTPSRPKKFKILLNGHLDVVPGKEEAYTPEAKGRKLYGVGALDMKANVAVLVAAFRDVAQKVNYPLGLQLVTDEEIGGFDGTKYQVEEGVRADFVIAGEPTNFDIVNTAKGVLWLKITAHGKTAHGAYPWRGENAIWKMQQFLAVLKKRFPTPAKEKWVTTINVAKIETGNQALNKIPDDCSISLDIRFVSEDAKTILRDVKKLLPKGCTVEVLANESALKTDPQNDYLRKLAAETEKVIKKPIVLRGANGTSDARHFASMRCPGIEFGSRGEGIGSDKEWVDIPSLGNYYEILTNFLLRL